MSEVEVVLEGAADEVGGGILGFLGELLGFGFAVRFGSISADRSKCSHFAFHLGEPSVALLCHTFNVGRFLRQPRLHLDNLNDGLWLHQLLDATTHCS